MKPSTLLRCLALVAVLSLGAYPVAATDVDGPDDCQRSFVFDYGDAPECTPAYPSGVIGLFPTCNELSPCGMGTQTFVCTPNSTPPGLTGAIRHIQSTQGFWLGCYSAAGGVLGIDAEVNGKTGSPATGTSVCQPITTDCVAAAFGMTFDQDECYADGSDAGVLADPGFVSCAMTPVPYNAYNCLPTQRQVFLNICVDWNSDGDWNDNFQCPGACAFEWPVKNVPVILGPGCNALLSPPILAGPFTGPGWMRISLTEETVLDDYPWNGSVGVGGGSSFAYRGGETEDYPVTIGQQTSNYGSSWGTLKTLYR